MLSESRLAIVTGPNIPRLRLTSRGEAYARRYRRCRAELYEPLMRPLERTLFAPLRSEQLRGLRGFGLEVGIGTGLSLPHYRDGARVIGVEPMAEMAAELAQKMSSRALRKIVRGHCERLPFHARSFDFVVGQFLCCSVADPAAAIREMHRVLRPGGQLCLLEHVRSNDPWLGRMQDALAPLWSQFAFGCRLNSNIRPALTASPFYDVRIESTALGLLESVTAFA